MYLSNFNWLINKLFLISWLLRLVQVIKLCPFLLSLDHRLKITHRLPNMFLPPVFPCCCHTLVTHFVLCWHDYVSACRQLSVCWRGALPEAVCLGRSPCSGVAFPSLNAMEWVADPQVLCRFPPLLRLGGSPTLSHALPWLGRRPCNPLRWLVGGPSLPCSVWWVKDLQLLWGPNVEYIYSAQVLARRWNCSPTVRVLLFPTFL